MLRKYCYHYRKKKNGRGVLLATLCLTLPFLLLSLLSTMNHINVFHNNNNNNSNSHYYDSRDIQILLESFFWNNNGTLVAPPQQAPAQEPRHDDPDQETRSASTTTTTLNTTTRFKGKPKMMVNHTYEVELPLKTDNLQGFHQWIHLQQQQQQQSTPADNNANNNEANAVLAGMGRAAPGTVVLGETDPESYSSLDYAACCGLGHRLGRMADAYHVAKQLKFELRGFWGWCQGSSSDTNTNGSNNNNNNNNTTTTVAQKTEVFSSLFEPTPPNELAYVNSTHLRLAIGNDVAGYGSATAVAAAGGGGSSDCACRDDKIASDLEFFTSLRQRFHRRAEVDQFVRDNFAGKLSLSLHIRAGNGETGDFANKQRHIANRDLWIQNVVKNIKDLVGSSRQESVLFVATDTPSYIDSLREALNGTMSVASWDQDRPDEGSGVFFGQHGAPTESNGCLRKWEDTVIDQMLFGSADVVIAGKMSTFSQTLPLSLAFGRTERKIKTPYCEVRGDDGEALQCFESYQQWCCNDAVSMFVYKRQTKMVRHNLMQVDDTRNHRFEVAPRLPDPRECHPHQSSAKPANFCLPHDYQATLAAL